MKMSHELLPQWRFLMDPTIKKMSSIEIDTFKERLERLIDQLPEESENLFTKKPRFAHAVLVLADENAQGEILKATCIKQLDNVLTIQREKIFLTNMDDVVIKARSEPTAQSNQSQSDKEIEEALRILHESREMVEETTRKISFPSEMRHRMAEKRAAYT